MGKRVTEDWKPQHDDMLMGWVTDAMVVMGTKWGEVGLAVVTERESKRKIGVWLSRSVLRGLFNEQRPAPGSAVVIRYIGKKVSPSSGRTYHRYTMRTETSMPPTGNDWIEDITDEFETRKATR